MHSIGTYCRIFFHIALVEVCSTHGDEGVIRLQLVLTRYLKKHIALKSLYRKDTDKAGDIFDRISQLRFILSKSSKIFENLVPTWYINILLLASTAIGVVYTNDNYSTDNYLFMEVLLTTCGGFLWMYAPQLVWGYRHLHAIFFHFASSYRMYKIPLRRISEEDGELIATT